MTFSFCSFSNIKNYKEITTENRRLVLYFKVEDTIQMHGSWHSCNKKYWNKQCHMLAQITHWKLWLWLRWVQNTYPSPNQLEFQRLKSIFLAKHSFISSDNRFFFFLLDDHNLTEASDSNILSEYLEGASGPNQHQNK